MTTAVRFALSLAVMAFAAGAAPARAACSRVCDEAYDMGGSTAEERAVAQQPARRHPAVEMTLPGYLWTKLRAEAHAAADRTAYALITATSRLAVIAAREKQEHDAEAPQQRPAPAPAGPQHSECTGTPHA